MSADWTARSDARTDGGLGGELEHEQRVRLREAVDRMLNADKWAEYQSAHESKLLSMLQTGATADVQTFLAAWLSGESRPEALRQCSTMAQWLASQRTRFVV